MTTHESSDPLDAALVSETLRSRLATGAARQLGGRVEYHERIDSTNDRARALAASGEPEGTIVIAGEQTAGRGRADRSWHSPPARGVYLSVILRPDAAPGDAPVLGLMAAVAVCESLRDIAGVPARIKWPNDVIVQTAGGHMKLAGILAEARTTTDGIRDLVIGVGVNLNHDTGDFPPEIAARSTSLRILTRRRFARAGTAVEILTRLDAWYTLWHRSGSAPILAAYVAAAVDLVGRRVRVTGARHDAEQPDPVGTTAGLGADGALRVMPDGGGSVLLIRYGEVLRLEEP